ncbi:hypothetical protein [Paraburkholderia sp. J41]|uniref:hypothetical protein n=1 Tax=Paraburkholderia sp. J41 TaxID=2805433 RepID=UPI002AC36A16|nr:hypothetical protein [Paraburkholderia sp. J41]
MPITSAFAVERRHRRDINDLAIRLAAFGGIGRAQRLHVRLGRAQDGERRSHVAVRNRTPLLVVVFWIMPSHVETALLTMMSMPLNVVVAVPTKRSAMCSFVRIMG